METDYPAQNNNNYYESDFKYCLFLTLKLF